MIAVTEHSNEHVDEDDNHDSAVSAKHEFPHKLSEVMVLLDLKVFDIHQSIDGKVQSLQDFKEAKIQIS